MFFKAVYHIWKSVFQFYDTGVWEVKFLMVPAFCDQVVTKLIVEYDVGKTQKFIEYCQKNLYWKMIHCWLRGISMTLLTHVYRVVYHCPLISIYISNTHFSSDILHATSFFSAEIALVLLRWMFFPHVRSFPLTTLIRGLHNSTVGTLCE